MFWHLTILISVAVGFTMATVIWAGLARRRFLKRPCAGIRWHRRFPNAPHEDIRAFLQLFSRSFGFKDHQICVFRPDDRVKDVNSAFEPLPMDAMELEEFADEYQRRYGLDLEKVWRDNITLGEMFDLTRH